MTVFPEHVKCSGPILKEIVLWRYLQSWLTVAMKCLVMYSYSRHASPPGKAERYQAPWTNKSLGMGIKDVGILNDGRN